jgi:hypothetical protein
MVVWYYRQLRNREYVRETKSAMRVKLDRQEQSVVGLRGEFQFDVDFRSERLGDNT